MDKNGFFWVKSGSDKRRVTAREEIQRISSGILYGDAMPANGLSLKDLDKKYFNEFIFRQYGEDFYDSWDEKELPLSQMMENLNLMKGNQLNIAGALLFAKIPQFKLPVFIIKAVSYLGNDIHISEY